MSKVLKADAAAADAWVEKTLAADQSNIWVTASVNFSGEAEALWAGGASGYFVYISDNADTTFVDYFGDAADAWAGAYGSGGTPTSGVWHACELHYDRFGNSELYIDGTLIYSNAVGATTLARRIRVGQDLVTIAGGTFDPRGIVYIDNVKIGTSRGASDLFSDDFESGTLSAWTTTSGAVSIVEDPFVNGICVAFGADALAAAPTWTRIDDPTNVVSVTAYQTRRGRSYITDKTQTGTATVSFVDTRGALDPTNSTGPFYPMNPNCPFHIRLYNPITGGWATIFRGLVQNVENELDISERVLNGTLTAADLFSQLSIGEIPPSVDFDSGNTGTNSANSLGDTTYAQQTVDDRIKTILADAGIPSSLTDIFSGNVQVQVTSESPGTKVLSALQDAADAEFPGVANLFVDKNGVICFRGREARFNPSTYGAHTWHCGDETAVLANPGWILIQGLTFDRDVEKIINAALFTPQGIAAADVAGQLSSDGSSITSYGLRGLSGSNLLTAGHVSPGTTDALGETKSYSDFYKNNYAAPRNRVSRLTLRSVPPDHFAAAAQWNMLCNVDIGDIVEITTAHPGGGGFSAEQFFVEGISYDAKIWGLDGFPDVVDVTCTLDLSSKEFFTTDTFPTS